MNLTINAENGIEPPPREVNLDELPGPGKLWAKWPKTLLVEPSEAALVRDKAGARLLAPAGKRPLDVQIADKQARVAMLPRDFGLAFELRGCAFAQGHEGDVHFWSKARLLDAEDHPLARAWASATDGKGAEALLAERLSETLGAFLRRLMLEVEYAPGVAAAALTEILAPLHDVEDMGHKLRRRAGIQLASPLIVRHAACPVLDEEASKKRKDDAADAARRREAATAQKEAAKRQALEGIRRREEFAALSHQHEVRLAGVATEEKEGLIRRQGEHERKKLEHKERVGAAEAALAEVAAAMGLAQIDVERAEAEEIRAAAATAEAEAERLRSEATLNEAKTEREKALAELLVRRADRLRREEGELQALAEGLDSILRRLDTLEAAPPAPTGAELSLKTAWRAYQRTGPRRGELIFSSLQTGQRLPSGAMLELETTASRDAWIYVAMKTAGGEWTVLVPDVKDLMRAGVGLGGRNRLTANEPAAWPGGNGYMPDLPFWMLDDKEVGYERILAIASLEEIDIQGIVDGEGVEQLLARAQKAQTRGVEPPTADNWIRADGAAASGPTYGEVFLALTGQGLVVDELVVDHY